MNNLGHISSDPRLLESFNSYKIFTLELISAFCNLKRIKAKSAENQNNNNISVKTNNDSLNDTQSENSSLIILGSQSLSSPVVFSASQELKIINLILRSIKNTDLNVNELVDEIYADSCNETGKEFGKHLLDRIDRISGDTLLELRNLMSDLKIYVIGPNLTDPLIRPWSVLGKYVRRCVIVYERMQFDKLVEICKRASGQFKQLSRYIYRSRAQHEMRSSESNAANSNSANAAGISMAVIPGSNSASLFLHEESNLTITSEWFNRSANAVDCSGMDLEPLDESINPQNQGNTSRIVSEIRLNPLDQKALTSTASAQRTQQSAFKSLSGKQQVTFQLPVTKLGDSSPFRVEATPIDADSNLMPPPQLASDQMVKNQLISSSQRIQAPITNGFAFSRKLAEYFVAKQAFLLENNEHEALAPYELEYKLDELIHNDPTFVDAYYLRFLNFLRLNDYPSALKALHDYFDRFILTSSVSLAALNLCSLEFRFGNRDNSLFALKEAITSAHQEGDNICLQHCLSWLYKIDHFNNADSSSRKNFLIKSSCSRSINYELFTLATYNLHYLARNSIGKKEPQTILSVLNKTDIANLKMNSKVELNLLSQCHKACLWGLYGHKKISSLFSQMLLTFSPKSNQNKLNTESQCIAMCYLAIEAAQNGQYSMSQNILSKCKEIYSSYTKTNHHFLFAENTIAIEKNLLQGKWSLCRWHIQKIATVNIQQACLHEMNIYIIESNFERAKEIGAKILSLMNRGIRQETADLDGRYSYFNAALDTNNNSLLNEQLNISLRFNFIQIYIGLREYSNALILAIKLYHEIKQVDFHYELMTCCLLVAKILIHMEHPEQAIKYIQKCIIFILSNGSLLDQAKMHYIYAKCLHLLDKRKNIQACISHMFECVKKLESIQGSIYLISAYAYLSLLLNESGNFEERNLYAGKFRRLREQLPLINYLL